MRDRIWQSSLREVIFCLSAFLALLSGIHADDPQQPLSAGGGNDTLLWGPYRPNLYFGVRPRLPNSLLTGLLWANADSYATIQNSENANVSEDGFPLT